MTVKEKIIELVSDTISGIENGKLTVTQIALRCIRIARLRNDYEALYRWLFEMFTTGDKEKLLQAKDEVSPHFTEADMSLLHDHTAMSFMKERTMLEYDPNSNTKTSKKVMALSIPELEVKIEWMANEVRLMQHNIEKLDAPPLSEIDIATSFRSQAAYTLSTHKSILGRIIHNAHEYLSQIEREISLGQINSNIFESNREYVDSKLALLFPDILDQFRLSYQRLSEKEPESRSQALLTCRRILKALADHLYPAKPSTVKGIDDVKRPVTDSHYLNRLWQFVSESTQKVTASELIHDRIRELGNRVDRIYELSSKGVHAEVEADEANQCVIHTYLIVGDILRLVDKSSGIEFDSEKSPA